MLRTLLNSAIAGTLLLLEDLDAAFTQSRDATGKERSLTFSGVQKERAKCIIACATMQCVSIVISVASMPSSRSRVCQAELKPCLMSAEDHNSAQSKAGESVRPALNSSQPQHFVNMKQSPSKLLADSEAGGLHAVDVNDGPVLGRPA